MKTIKRFFAGLLAAAFILTALPLSAFATGDYETVLDGISRLQALADSYAQDHGRTKEPLILTLDYIRTGRYNDTLWQMVAGVPDEGFAAYVAGQDPALADLQSLDTVTLPGLEQTVDFQHLLAAADMAYQGIYAAGSWGGDCMELAQQSGGGDLETCYAAAQSLFNVESGQESTFSRQDLRADMDAVNIGDALEKGDSLADTIREYYARCTEQNRAETFVASQFGSVDTGDRDGFRTTVYTTLLRDDAMQILLYFSNHWDKSNWAVNSDFEAPLAAACYVLADHLADVLGGASVSGSGVSHGLGSGVSAGLTGAAGASGVFSGSGSLPAAANGLMDELKDALLEGLAEKTGIPAGALGALALVAVGGFVLILFLLWFAAFWVGHTKRLRYAHQQAAEAQRKASLHHQKNQARLARERRSPMPPEEAGFPLPPPPAVNERRGGVPVGVAPVRPAHPVEVPVGVTPLAPVEVPVGVTPLAPVEVPVGVTPIAPLEMPVGVTPIVPVEVPVGVTPLAPVDTPVSVAPTDAPARPTRPAPVSIRRQAPPSELDDDFSLHLM